jgi:D-sedoheptulose 7-phosphate isomerase
MDYLQDITKYLESLKNTLEQLNLNTVNELLNVLRKAYEDEKTIFIMGNGGSAATASHFVCDFNMGICRHRSKKFRMISLNDNVPSMLALANDIGYESIFLEQLKCLFQPGDYVMGISGSGNSENVIQAIKYAKQHEGITLALTGYSGGKLKALVDHNIHVNIDDMQIAEDIHMMLDHLMMRVLNNRLP